MEVSTQNGFRCRDKYARKQDRHFPLINVLKVVFESKVTVGNNY